jgi:hypothetical protein
VARSAGGVLDAPDGERHGRHGVGWSFSSPADQRLRQCSKMNLCSLQYGASWWRITELAL